MTGYKGHLLRGSEIIKRFGHSRTHQRSPTLYHDFGCLHFYGYTVHIMVRIGATWSTRSNRTFTIYAVEVTTSIVL